MALGMAGGVSSVDAAASAPPLLTILDGEASLIIGVRAVAAIEGLRLAPGTLVHTSASTTLLRLEWPGGEVLDLGPDTRVMLQPEGLAGRGEAAPAFYLLSGWAKQRGTSAAHRGHVAPLTQVLPGKGTVVVQAAAAGSWLFAEAGEAALVERAAVVAKRLLPTGQSYQRNGASKGEIAARPAPDMLRQVPRGFRDTLPLRADRFTGKEPTPKPLPAPTYDALAPWLAAEPAIRREFPRRFAPLLREPGFRAAVADRLAAHPEWEPVLFPERFVRPASAPSGARP